MKTYLKQSAFSVIVLLAGNVSVHAQAYFYMGDTANIEVFAPQPLASSTLKVTYNGYTGYEAVGPVGSGSYTSPGSSPVFVNPTPIGNGFDVILLAGVGAGVSLGQLSPVSRSLTSSWVPGGGFWNSSTTVVVPGAVVGETATVAAAVWQATGPNGTATTIEQAQSLGYEWGISPLANVVLTSPGPGMTAAIFPSSIGDFSLVTYVSPIPEPSCLALFTMGGAMALRRLRKNN